MPANRRFLCGGVPYTAFLCCGGRCKLTLLMFQDWTWIFSLSNKTDGRQWNHYHILQFCLDLIHKEKLHEVFPRKIYPHKNFVDWSHDGNFLTLYFAQNTKISDLKKRTRGCQNLLKEKHVREFPTSSGWTESLREKFMRFACFGVVCCLGCVWCVWSYVLYSRW